MTTRLTCPRCNSTNVEAHLTTMLPKNEADVYAPVREYGYFCKDCKLTEIHSNTEDGLYEFRDRWKDIDHDYTTAQWIADGERRQREEELEKRAWMWPDEAPPGHGSDPTDRTTRRTKLEESRQYDEYTVDVARERGKQLPEFKYGYPVGEEYVAAVLARPDDDVPRLDYARWLRTFENPAAQATASFIEWQIRMARAFRDDPRADIRDQLPDLVFAEQAPPVIWWRVPGADTRFGDIPGIGERGIGESTAVFEQEGLISDSLFYRGFVEHVAVRASRFLEIADELYSLAPIRQLTITYCKGPDHTDHHLFRRLLDSPHLDRIRALRLPVRAFGYDNEYTQLNRFTNADIAALGASKHLKRVSYLDLSDHNELTIDAFHALAASAELPMLSFVLHDIYHYGFTGEFSFGNMGRQTRTLLHRPLQRYRGAIEAKHGRRAWLHPVENYGSEDPDVEAVVEHPFPKGPSAT